MHLAIISNGVKVDKKLLNELWKASLPSSSSYCSVYVARVESVVGLANYLPKNVKRAVVVPPGNFRGRIFFATHRFLTKTVKKLWEELREEWYGNKTP